MKVDFSKSPDGLVPAIVQDAQTHKVLMLGYMNEEALARTKEEGKVTFDINTGRWKRPGGTPRELGRTKSGTERNQKQKNSLKNHSVH